MIELIHRKAYLSATGGRRQGFTLIRFLVIIAIISVLAAVFLPVLSRARVQARYARWLYLRESNQADPRVVGFWTFEEIFEVGGVTKTRNLALAGSDIPESLDGIFGRGPAHPTWIPAGDPVDDEERNRLFLKPTLSFDGDDYVIVPEHPDLDITDMITIEVWVKPIGEAITAWSAILGRGLSSSWGIFSERIPNRVHFRIWTSAGEATIKSASTFNLEEDEEEWVHLVFVYDGAQMRIYWNGLLDGPPVNHSGIIDNTGTNFYISNFSDRHYRFNGLVDEVVIFNVALSSDEIKDRFLMSRGW